MASTVAEHAVCSDVRRSLSRPRLSRDEVIAAGQALLDIEYDLERRVRAFTALHGATPAVTKAHRALHEMKQALRWIEGNRYGGFQSELQRQVQIAHASAEEILNAHAHVPRVQQQSGFFSRLLGRSSRWDGVERRSGLDRRREVGAGPKTSVPFERRRSRDRRRAPMPMA
ncbi:MAG TPA: hypothetical protein VF898_12760 [Chloroflexota bacterium]